MKFIKNKKFILVSLGTIMVLSSIFLLEINTLAVIDGHPWGTIKIFHGLLLNLF